MFGSGMATLIISNEEMDDIMKIVKYLEDSSLLIKSVSETVESEAKEHIDGFLGNLLGILEASILGSILEGKGVIKVGEGLIRAGERTIRAGQDF